MPGKGQYMIDKDMLQLQDAGRRGTSFLQMSRLQAREGSDAKEKCVLFQPQDPRTILRGNSCNLSTGLPPPLRHNQQVPNQSVQAPTTNSSSLNEMFTVVETVYQQDLTEPSGAEPEENRIMAIAKIVLKLMKKNGR
jgi:hypothetical protein